jgi:hypothetical protein
MDLACVTDRNAAQMSVKLGYRVTVYAAHFAAIAVSTDFALTAPTSSHIVASRALTDPICPNLRRKGHEGTAARLVLASFPLKCLRL